MSPQDSITLSLRAQRLTSSAIREILKLTERPEVISFAGGLPSPATFPVERMREAAAKVLSDTPHAALQYAPTEGLMPLREWIAAHLHRKGIKASPAKILIVSGSQQGLDLIGKCLVDEGSKLLVESPSYLGALQAFSMFQPAFVSMPSDQHGIDTDALTPQLLAGARLMYCLPNFQNPTGSLLPLQRRLSLLEKAASAGVPVLEDDPYGELSYTGQSLPSLQSLAPGKGIYMGTFSKVVSPGLRVGYVTAPEPLFTKLVEAKQAADLHTPSFNQRIVYEVVKDGFLDTHIPSIRALYGRQCGHVLAALERHFPPQVRWSRPEGGMFIWVTLPAGLDASELLTQAIAQNVAFVPGAPFFAGEPQNNTLRLSFVTVPPEKIEAGIARLGALVKAQIETLPAGL